MRNGRAGLVEFEVEGLLLGILARENLEKTFEQTSRNLLENPLNQISNPNFNPMLNHEEELQQH
jgi:hypothetical protein